MMPTSDSFRHYVGTYLDETIQIARQIDQEQIVRAIQLIEEFRAGCGRLFILGVGGSAGNASHAVNDFRKITGIEAYTPTDNVAELTAWVNDVNWDSVFEAWLKESRLQASDLLLIFSVGGGSAATSQNLVRAMQFARQVQCKIVAVVSRDGGMAKQLADVTILVPVVSPERITPHAEGWQAVIWHLIVNALGPNAE